MNVEFVDELPGGNRGVRGKYVEFFDALRDNAGKWAKFPDQDDKTSGYKNSTRTFISQGKVSGSAPARAFEAAVRQGTLYVRYVGGAA